MSLKKQGLLRSETEYRAAALRLTREQATREGQSACVRPECEQAEQCDSETPYLRLLYHFLLGSTRCWKPSEGPVVAAGPTAMMSWQGN